MWGADRSTLLKLYRSLVRSKLDYGCYIYGSARKSYLQCLDTIHHLGLRLGLGAFRTSPTESLYAEANETPLSLRRKKLSLQYFTKLQSCPFNPAYNCTIHPKYKELFASKETAIPSFGIRMESLLQNSNINTDNIHESTLPEIPPWTHIQPNVILNLTDISKKETQPAVFMEKYNTIKENFTNYTHFLH